MGSTSSAMASCSPDLLSHIYRWRDLSNLRPAPYAAGSRPRLLLLPNGVLAAKLWSYVPPKPRHRHHLQHRRRGYLEQGDSPFLVVVHGLFSNGDAGPRQAAMPVRFRHGLGAQDRRVRMDRLRKIGGGDPTVCHRGRNNATKRLVMSEMANPGSCYLPQFSRSARIYAELDHDVNNSSRCQASKHEESSAPSRLNLGVGSKTP